MTTWRRPCDAGHCIEVSTDVPGLNPGDIAIRNSQRPGTVVVASAEEYAAWVADVSAPLLAELAEVTRQRDEARANECTALCRDIEQDRDEIRAALDEARAKVDGGEWHEQRGVRWPNGDVMWGDHTARYSSLPRVKRRVWLGPPEADEPATDRSAT